MKYRKLTRADVPAAHRLSLEVQWPHRLEDWQFVQRLGHGFVAEDRDGIVGTILYWKHDRRNASLGMVIVSPERQGRGIGRHLMDLAFEDLKGRTVSLHATTAGRSLYERLGFRAVDEVEQHQGAAGHVSAASLARGERLRPVGASDAPLLAALATQAAGMDRTRLVSRLLDEAQGIVLDRDGEPIGFALFRRFGLGHAIGPVIAPDADRAKLLIGHWAALHNGRFLRVDVPRSSGLGDWLEGIGLKKVSTVIAMVKGAASRKDPAVGSFALVNQALG